MVAGSLPTAYSRAKTKRAYYMRLNLRLSEVKPERFELPKQCPTADGAVAIALESLGIGVGKTSVYRAVQAAAEKAPGMKQAHRIQENQR